MVDHIFEIPKPLDFDAKLYLRNNPATNKDNKEVVI